MRKVSAAAAMLLGLAGGLPPLGQQDRILPRVNASGEVLTPKRKTKLTKAQQRDADLLELRIENQADEKRTRKNLRRLRDYWRSVDNYHPHRHIEAF